MSSNTIRHPAGPDHEVVETHGAGKAYRRKVCSNCPWRRDSTGIFPADAFRHSAKTARDMSSHRFGCHQSGSKTPTLCAGFLLRGADNNLSIRIARMRGEILDIDEPDTDLFDDYTEMAIANGVEPDDPALADLPKSNRND